MSLATNAPLHEIFAQHPHWQQVQTVVRALSAKGFTAYLAGGAVRDALLGEPVHDFDIVTSALPEDLEEIIKRATGKHALDIGKQFGIMMIPVGDGRERIEMATFRSDGAYVDGRHPQSVTFASAEEDAKRRDFTVNALFYDFQKDRVIDFVQGLKDLKGGIIRAVGEPRRRFQEDKLRLLRAVRFSAQLGFQIEPETYRAIQALADELRVVSRERITAELVRLSQARNVASGFAALIDTGLFRVIFEPLKFIEVEQYRNRFLRALARLSGIGSLELILSLMFIVEIEAAKSHGRIAQVTDKVLQSFSLSRASYHYIHFLVNGAKSLREDPEAALMCLDTEEGPLLSELGFSLESIGLLPHHRVGQILERYLKLAGNLGRLPAPFVNGNDLKDLGVAAGPKIGEILAVLYKKQLRGEIVDRGEALQMARQIL